MAGYTGEGWDSFNASDDRENELKVLCEEKLLLGLEKMNVPLVSHKNSSVVQKMQAKVEHKRQKCGSNHIENNTNIPSHSKGGY